VITGSLSSQCDYSTHFKSASVKLTTVQVIALVVVLFVTIIVTVRVNPIRHVKTKSQVLTTQ